ALPEALKGEVDKMRMQPYEATLRDVEAFMKGERFDGDRLKLALAPTIPLHCSDAFLGACRDCARRYGLG
ncbi:hypothetical protein, partial [Enterobacter hormaechei]|uniref:hypothetical protein n=1 Tax=Enterobacter hormaechei TaxID=158836 RepID=UPI001954A472